MQGGDGSEECQSSLQGSPAQEPHVWARMMFDSKPQHDSEKA